MEQDIVRKKIEVCSSAIFLSSAVILSPAISISTSILAICLSSAILAFFSTPNSNTFHFHLFNALYSSHLLLPLFSPRLISSLISDREARRTEDILYKEAGATTGPLPMYSV